MTKLPINFLLFVAIMALLGGSGWNFYKAVTDKAGIDQKVNRKEFEDVTNRGVAAAGVQTDGLDWSDRTFWENFKDANFIGKHDGRGEDQLKDPVVCRCQEATGAFNSDP